MQPIHNAAIPGHIHPELPALYPGEVSLMVTHEIFAGRGESKGYLAVTTDGEKAGEGNVIINVAIERQEIKRFKIEDLGIDGPTGELATFFNKNQYRLIRQPLETV